MRPARKFLLRPLVTRESAEQVTLFEWAARFSRLHPELECLHAIPNGGYGLPIQTAVRLKREGLRRGYPDVSLPVPRGGFASLLIEMKSAVGIVKPEQRDWHVRLRRWGNKVAVCHGWEEASKVILEYLGRSR